MTKPDDTLAGLVERLRAAEPLPICPYDLRSPEYWTTPDDAPCKFCGGEPKGPDLCRGADTRLFAEAAARITALEAERDGLQENLTFWLDQATRAEAECARLRASLDAERERGEAKPEPPSSPKIKVGHVQPPNLTPDEIHAALKVRTTMPLPTAAEIDALVASIHQQNVEAGWWTDLKTGASILETRNVGEILMLCVSELSEAMEGHRKNLPDDKLPHRPMFEVELADTVIRIFDLVGARCAEGFGAIVEELLASAEPVSQNTGEALLQIVKLLVEAHDMLDYGRSSTAQGALAHAYVRIEELSADRGCDLWGAVEEKRAFNRQRADHKPAARLAAGGKAY